MVTAFPLPSLRPCRKAPRKVSLLAPSTIAPRMVRAQPSLIKGGDGLIMAATTTEGGRGQGRDDGEAEVDAVCDVGVVVVSAQDPNEEAKAAVGEAEVRVYMECGRLYFGCSQLYSFHAC